MAKAKEEKDRQLKAFYLQTISHAHSLPPCWVDDRGLYWEGIKPDEDLIYIGDRQYPGFFDGINYIVPSQCPHTDIYESMVVVLEHVTSAAVGIGGGVAHFWKTTS